MTSGGPVFVAGLERTGTSLMYALLASHPDIAMTRRTNLWPYFYNRYGSLSDRENLERCLDVMSRYKRLRVLDIDWDRLRAQFLDGPSDYARLFALLEQQVAEREGKPRWGDKSLHTERYARPILDAYPDARILHMMRDPRDRFASVIARWKVRRGGVGAGIAEWGMSADLARRNVAANPDRYRIVRYEDLVTRPVEALRDICVFVGVDYSDEMLDMGGAPEFRDQGNSSYGPRRAGVISAESVGKYVSVLSADQVRFIEGRIREPMAAFGYSPSRPEQGGGAGYLVRTWVPETARYRGWQARQRRRERRGLDVPDYRLVDGDDGS